MEYKSASYFFGSEAGEERCFFCGNSCGTEYSKKDYVKKTFTNHDIVISPGSNYVCSGCVISTGMGQPGFRMIDGSYKEATTKRGGAPRLYSWILSNKSNVAANKGHMKYLRESILSPPEPPFAIVLADSGKKQIIFRCPVSMSRDGYPLQWEEELLIINTAELYKYLTMADKCSAACGKMGLAACEDQQFVSNVYKYYGSTVVFEEWQEVYGKPLARLAAWLAKPKKEAQIAYPRVDT